jgi:hypothetical protein
MTDSDDPVFKVRRQWNDWRMADYRLSQIENIHWDTISGGVNRRTNQPYLHGYVMCNAMISGKLSHSCKHGPPPHRIKICITKKWNQKIWCLAEAKIHLGAK